MPIKEIEPIFSRGGYSIWKIESEGQSDPKRSKELKKPFVVKNCLGTEVGSFGSEEDAHKILDKKIQLNKFIKDLLENVASFSQIAIFVSLFFSLFIGFFIYLSYLSRYNQIWLFPKIFSLDSIKLFSIGFVFSLFMFYLPIIYGVIIKNSKYYYILNILGSFFIFIVTWFPVKQLLSIDLDDSFEYLSAMIVYFIVVLLLVHVSHLFSKRELSNNHSRCDQIQYYALLLLIPIFLYCLPFYTNFSKLVFKITGMGARMVSLQFPNDDLTTANPELRMILYKLNAYPNGSKKYYCLFTQTSQEFYITKDDEFCNKSSPKKSVGDLIRVPMKYVVSIGEPLPHKK